MPDAPYYTTERLRFLRVLLAAQREHVRSLIENSDRELQAVDTSVTNLEPAEAALARRRDIHDKIEGLGHRLLLVGLAALVEAVFKIMLHQQVPNAKTKGKDWGGALSRLDLALGATPEHSVIRSLDGFAFADLVRILSNIFKHDDGFARARHRERLEEWRREHDDIDISLVVQSDGKVDFGALDMEVLIDQVGRFLRGLEDAPLA